MPTIPKVGGDGKARWYLAACVCLLIVTSGLRFYDLPGNSLWLDEAKAANFARGSLSETVANTQCCNSSPILYPVVLWAVQKVESSAFSVRLVPAAASVLTVAAILFLLPRVGVNRKVAFLAALMAVFSERAIWHAQDVREYSIDALLAALMIAGLLWYLRDGRKALLCAALLVGPLVQYGLVLFGAAVIGAAIILPHPQSLAGQEYDSGGNRVWNWLKERLGLAWPGVFFLVGCNITFLVTLQYQWTEGGFGASYLGAYYYDGSFSDVRYMLDFIVSNGGGLLGFHFSKYVAYPALAAFGVLLLASVKNRRIDAITVVLLIAVAVSIGAALARIYPYGETYQTMYLGPILFLAFGLAFYSAADLMASLVGRKWLAQGLLAVVAGLIIYAGVNDIRQNSPYLEHENVKAILAVLDEEAREDDVVYISSGAFAAVEFYQRPMPENYYYGRCGRSASMEECVEDMLGQITSPTQRIWVAFTHGENGEWSQVEFLDNRIELRQVVDERRASLYLVENLYVLRGHYGFGE